MIVKVPVEITLRDGSQENCRTESMSRSRLYFASSLQMQIGDSVRVRVGLDPPAEQRGIPARITWRHTAKGQGRTICVANLDTTE
jgi:hypothetical protein